jgi:HSP20 family molecular chaperone IbpA
MMQSSPSFNQRCASPLLKNTFDNEDATLQEDETCFLLSMEIPDVNGKDIQISLRDNTLMVGGFRSSSSSSDRRKRQRISHTFEIDPEVVDLDRAIANVFKGCLTLYAPKRSSSSSSSLTLSVVDSDDDDELDCSL